MRRRILVKTFLLSVVLTAFSSVVWGKTDDKTALYVAVRALTVKLQKDLAADEIDLRFSKVDRRDISAQKIVVSGEGFANDFPINFDVAINAKSSIPTAVKYNFIENAKTEFETAESDTESNLIQGLLGKLNADYKTKNIVVAPDGFELIEKDGKKAYKGNGEIRLGSMVWKRIDFEISVNADSQVSDVKYRIQ